MPIHDLPREIHHEILSHLDELIDQIAAAAASPLWSSILQTKSLKAARYRSDPCDDPGYPLVHNIFFDIGNQISCVVRNGIVQCYRLRFQKGAWWENPNLQDTWDISACPFLEEPLILPAPGSGDKPPWKLEISTSSPLSYSYAQPFQCTGTTTVRDFVDAATGGNINLPGYLEGEGMRLDTYNQEMVLYQASVYSGSIYSDYKNPHAMDPEVIVILRANIVGRSTKQYKEWMETDQHLQTTARRVPQL
ncbi:hypothetical protein TWF281_000030 [Arthrobotrys megalospora]